ncbi:hypothetical protein BASA50_010156 [Batrachochytrium salamandrivorans]|uniref:SAP domain-containing protein n=1 Tax=Batrachochytrium salamandrivorans TaxID=1357716 RepID=A0ABQ8F240_9FUNG|nr:hypothetical protein BASA50_010156 [Batrachochytrium salamandrivorans]
MHRHSLLRSSLVVGAATVLSRTTRNTATVAALAPIRSAAVATTYSLQHQFLEIIGWTKLASLGRYLGLTHQLTKTETIKRLKSHMESTPSMLLSDGSIDFESTMFTHHQIHPKELHSVRNYQLRSLCSALGISVSNSNDELIDKIYLHIKRNPSAIAGNSTVDLLSSSDAVDDSTNHPTTKQSMTAVLKRLRACDRRQLLGLCNSFEISEYRNQDILVVMVQDHLRQNPSMLSPNGTIPLRLLLSRGDKFASAIKSQLLDSASPLVEEGGMVNLQFTPKLSKKETSDISNMPIHINRLDTLSISQLITLCKMFGASSSKSKPQLVEEIRLYLTSNPSAVAEDGVLILGNENLLRSNSSKKTLSKPMYLHSLNTSHKDDIWVICRSYGISEKISKAQLLERFRAHLHKHSQIIRTDGTVDLVALAHTNG